MDNFDDYNGGKLELFTSHLATIGKSRADLSIDELMLVSIVFLAITYLAVFLRCFVRIGITKSFTADDWFLILAQVGTLRILINHCLPISRSISHSHVHSFCVVYIMEWGIITWHLDKEKGYRE